MACTKLHFIITLFSCSSAMFCIEKELGYKCCANYYWNLTEGNCTECKLGSFGLNCSEECEDGFYGRWCENKCGKHCKSCNKVNGTCNEVNTTDLEDKTTFSFSSTIGLVTSPAPSRQSKRGSLLYVVISIGSSAVLVLLVVLMKNIYTITTLPPKQNFLLTIQDPESKAAQNTVNPAFDLIYENPN